MSKEATPDEQELIDQFIERFTATDGDYRDDLQPLLLNLIRESRIEAVQDCILVCEQYAEGTTYLRKAAAARECIKRIRDMGKS